jgi:iron(III) transport system ATP-binding protein
MHSLVIENLELDYGSTSILKGVNIDAEEGEIVALLGRSGCGKSTLLRCIAGLEDPKSGRVKVGGRDLFNSSTGVNEPPERRNSGVVFQSYALWPHMTVFNNVAFPLKIKKVSASQIRNRVGAVLEDVGLSHLAARYPSELSGGQQQRVAVARAMIHRPPILLLDEPLSNLDAQLRIESRQWIRDIIKSEGMTAIFVTHDKEEAFAVADKIVILNEGKVEAVGTPQDIHDRMGSRFVAEFLGETNMYECDVTLDRSGSGLTNICMKGIEYSFMTESVSVPRGDGAYTMVVRSELGLISGGMRVQPLSESYLGGRWQYKCSFDGGMITVQTRNRQINDTMHVDMSSASIVLI